MKITLILRNLREEEVVRASVESQHLDFVNNVVHNGHHYAYSSISYNDQCVVYRAVCKPVELTSIKMLEVIALQEAPDKTEAPAS